MNFEKALALYRNDKTLQILRADHFPLLVSFFHLAFKQQERIAAAPPNRFNIKNLNHGFNTSGRTQLVLLLPGNNIPSSIPGHYGKIPIAKLI